MHPVRRAAGGARRRGPTRPSRRGQRPRPSVPSLMPGCYRGCIAQLPTDHASMVSICPALWCWHSSSSKPPGRTMPNCAVPFSPGKDHWCRCTLCQTGVLDWLFDSYIPKTKCRRPTTAISPITRTHIQRLSGVFPARHGERIPVRRRAPKACNSGACVSMEKRSSSWRKHVAQASLTRARILPPILIVCHALLHDTGLNCSANEMRKRPSARRSQIREIKGNMPIQRFYRVYGIPYQTQEVVAKLMKLVSSQTLRVYDQLHTGCG